MSAAVQSVVEISDGLEKGENNKTQRKATFQLFHKRYRGDESKSCRPCRKRPHRGSYCEKHALTGGSSHKRRKKDLSIPPTKFLLGGNIRDPLNLNSLKDEEVNRRLNAVTPETSPMPTPQWKKGEVEVLLPPNIHDPLNLEAGDDTDPMTPVKKCRKKHKKKKHTKVINDSKSDESKTEENTETGTDVIPNSITTVQPPPEPIPEVASDSEKTPSVEPKDMDPPAPKVVVDQPPKEVQPQVKEDSAVKPAQPPPQLNLEGSKKPKNPKKASVDKIVSPVVPQPGAWNCGNRRKGGGGLPAPPPPQPRIQKQPTPKFKECNKRFQYGNYNRYYGYRNAEYETDPRLRILESQRDLFEGKEVLDIGCNTGQVTLAVAKGFGAKRVVGLDLDRKLVEAARRNVKHYIRVGGRDPSSFPISMPLVYGPLPPQPSHHSQVELATCQTFPHNISFLQGNYVLTNDVLLGLETAQFDTILCLSVTKWFHLNWGDEGLKRAFRRMFAQLRPGGALILEPQPWPSYKKKKNITETTWKNYQNIQFFPHKFTQFLLSEVGFCKCEILGSPMHHSKGFQRPIRVYTKPTTPRRPMTTQEVTETKEPTTQEQIQEIAAENRGSPTEIVADPQHLSTRTQDQSPASIS